MTLYYNNNEQYGDFGPFDIEDRGGFETLAKNLSNTFDETITAEDLREALVPAVVIRRTNGDYLNDDGDWTPVRDAAALHPVDTVYTINSNEDVCMETFFSHSEDVDSLDVGWSDEDGDIFARAELA